MTDRTIFRTVKDKDNPYVMVDKRPIENPKLSWRAKGILVYLLSRPDSWIVRLRDLANRSPEGVYAIRSAIKELTAAGHITRREERENGKFKQYVLEVHEVITCPPSNLPQAVPSQAVDLTHSNNESLASKDSSNPKPPSKKKDFVDAILDFQREPQKFREAIAIHFKLTPNWEAKYNRQFLEWAVEQQITSEQVKLAAERWAKDEKFNWGGKRGPDLRLIQENWLLLVKKEQSNDTSRPDPELERLRAEAKMPWSKPPERK